MPTCRHQPCAVLPQFKGETGTPKLSFYPAALWGGPEDRWRVMRGTSWVNRTGESKSFWTLSGLRDLVLEHLRDGLGISGPDSVGIPVSTPRHTRVRWHSDAPDAIPQTTRTRTEPFRERGEWRVWVFGSASPVLLADLELVK